MVSRGGEGIPMRGHLEAPREARGFQGGVPDGSPPGSDDGPGLRDFAVVPRKARGMAIVMLLPRPRIAPVPLARVGQRSRRAAGEVLIPLVAATRAGINGDFEVLDYIAVDVLLRIICNTSRPEGDEMGGRGEWVGRR